METKDGKRFYKISVSRGRGKSKYTMRWYWPDGWSKRTAERELAKVVAEFELKCQNGEVMNRAEAKQKEEEARAEAAKLRTVRQYADGVYMSTKETTFRKRAISAFSAKIRGSAGYFPPRWADCFSDNRNALGGKQNVQSRKGKTGKTAPACRDRKRDASVGGTGEAGEERQALNKKAKKPLYFENGVLQ